MSDQDVSNEDLQRAVACARAHAEAKALGAFVYAVLSSQAEGRALFAGQKFMAQRAEQHGVDGERAATELGNLLSILERGPANSAEHALLSAFAARGAADLLAAAEVERRRELADKLVGELDWLELATRYRLAACIEAQPDAEAKAALHTALADAVLRDDRAVAPGDPGLFVVRARNTLRLSLLGRAARAEGAGAGAKAELARVRSGARDSATRALSAVVGGELPQAAPEPERVFGRATQISARPLVVVLRWLTGFALLHALWRALAFLLRVRREVELSFDGRVLRAERRTRLLGRTVRSSQAVYPVERVQGATRSGRYALLRTVVGALALSLGVLAGGYFGVDAARGGASTLLALAATLCALGVGVDLALELLAPAVRGQVQLQVDLAAARPLALAGVPVADAERFLSALDRRMGTGTI